MEIIMQKDEKLNITKDNLIEATFSLMEQTDDPLSVTSRQIAAKAGTKPSMINYCFGSRENLIHNVFQKKYLNFVSQDKLSELIESDITPKELLKELHYIVAKCLVDNFTFTKAVTSYILFKRDLGQESFSFAYVKKHYDGRKSDEECKLIAYELSTMMQLIIYRKEDIKESFGIDLDKDDELRKYINMRVDLLLGE
jgi:AcrR family transcriptional regulator